MDRDHGPAGLLVSVTIALTAILINAKFRIDSSEGRQWYYHLYATGVFLLIKSATSLCDSYWPDDYSFATLSYNTRAAIDHSMAFHVARSVQRAGELMMVGGVYGVCYIQLTDYGSWSWGFTSAVVGAWTFLAGILYGPNPLRFDSAQSLTKTRFMGDAVLWSAFIGLVAGTVIVPRATLRNATSTASVPNASSQIFGPRLTRAPLLVLGMISPYCWLIYLKWTHSSDGAILQHFQDDWKLFALSTGCLVLWTISYLALSSSPNFSSSAQALLGWLLSLIASFLITSQPLKGLFNQSVALIYPAIVVMGIARSCSATTALHDRRSATTEVKDKLAE